MFSRNGLSRPDDARTTPFELFARCPSFLLHWQLCSTLDVNGSYAMPRFSLVNREML